MVTLEAAGSDGGGKKKGVDYSELEAAALLDEEKGWRSEHVTNVSSLSNLPFPLSYFVTCVLIIV